MHRERPLGQHHARGRAGQGHCIELARARCPRVHKKRRARPMNAPWTPPESPRCAPRPLGLGADRWLLAAETLLTQKNRFRPRQRAESTFDASAPAVSGVGGVQLSCNLWYNIMNNFEVEGRIKKESHEEPYGGRTPRHVSEVFRV